MKRLYIIIPIVAVFLAGCQKEPIADFVFTPAQPQVGESVVFTNISGNAETFEWDFNDGTITNIVDPIHTFVAAGTYTVTLKAFNRRGEMSLATTNITVTGNPFSDFDVTTNLPGAGDIVTDLVYVGEQVTFFNYSENALSYLWEFGDGNTATLASPSYSYDNPGTYTVTLNAYGSGSVVDSYSRTIYVSTGLNSTVRITVLSLEDNPEDDYPLEDVEVTLYPTIDDWDNFTNPANASPALTTPFGKVILEGLNNQVYYVDAWSPTHDNEGLGLLENYEDWIATQQLTPNTIHDFVAYVEEKAGKKSISLEKISEKRLPRADRSAKKAITKSIDRENKYSKER